MPRVPSATRSAPARSPGRPAKAKAGALASALQGAKAKAKPRLPERITEYALQDAGIGRMPIFRPMPLDETSEVDRFLYETGVDAPLSVGFTGYAVRLPGVFVRDKALAEQGYPDGLPISLVAICPFGASVADEDLLFLLLCFAALGSSNRPRGRMLDVFSQFVLSQSPEAMASDDAFQIDVKPHLADEVVSEFIQGGRQDQSVVEGHRLLIRCRSEILLREWLGRSDSYAAMQLRRSLGRLGAISYLARRMGGNALGEWGGLKLLRYEHDYNATDGRDLTVEFSPRLTCAMFGLVSAEGQRVRNAYARINLRERFSLSRGLPRTLHRLLSVEVWEPQSKSGRGRPKKGVTIAQRDYYLDPLVEALWGPVEEETRRRRRRKPRPEIDAIEREEAQTLLRGRRRNVTEALVEIATKLPGWKITEHPLSGRITVEREMREPQDEDGDEDDGSTSSASGAQSQPVAAHA